MFSLIFTFIFSTVSVYVPFQNTETPILMQFGQKDFEKAKSLFRPFVILVVNNYARQKSNEAIDIMADMSLEFGNKVLIGMMQETFATEIYEDVERHLHGQNPLIQAPFIAYYDIGRLVYITNFINDEVAISHTLNFWINGPKHVSNYDELLKAVGNTPVSIISKKNALKEAFNITSKVLMNGVPIELIQAEDELFDKMNLSNYNSSVFVGEDLSINGFSDYDDFLKASRPHFLSDLQMNDVSNTVNNKLEKTIVAVFDNETKLEYGNVLYELKEKYPQFLYGVAKMPLLFELYSKYTHKEIEDVPRYLIFNREEKYYYPLPQLKGNDANSILNEYVKLVVDGQIPKEFISEDEAFSEKNDDGITQLIGKNFEDFVNDTESDSIVFFESPESWPYYYQFFKDTYLNVSSYGLKIKFGCIDGSRNSSPYRFPKIYSSPHIQLFLKDGISVPMLNIVNEEGILRFLHFFASEGQKIICSNFTASEARSEKYRIGSVYKNAYDDYLGLFDAMFENAENPAHLFKQN